MVKAWTDLSVLIVGCGSIGKRHARVLRSLGVADIRACDPSAEQRQLLSAESPNVRMYDSYDAGLRDRPDTVLICTPPEMHIPMALPGDSSRMPRAHWKSRCPILSMESMSWSRWLPAAARRSWLPCASATTRG